MGASGEYEIPEGITQKYGVDGEVYIVLMDEKTAYISGKIKLTNWVVGKYYLVVWCVDEYGNARVVAYDPAKDPRMVVERPVVRSGNIIGPFDPVKSDKNYFYLFGEELYVPYVKTISGEFQGCFVIHMSSGVNASFWFLGGFSVLGLVDAIYSSFPAAI